MKIAQEAAGKTSLHPQKEEDREGVGMTILSINKSVVSPWLEAHEIVLVLIKQTADKYQSLVPGFVIMFLHKNRNI